MVIDETITSSQRNDRLKRELARLRTSPSLRLGAHITDAIRRPWRAIFIPITLPFLMLIIGLELIGKVAPPNVNYYPRIADKGDNNTIMMFPTNGVGFGHFTRLLALARRYKKFDPDINIIFFTTMPTLHLLMPDGFPAHHVSGRKKFNNMTSDSWNSLIEEELALALDFHNPGMFIFDGAFPYRGMLRAIQSRKMQRTWVRRGTFRKGSSIPVDSIEYFDLIIRPEDSVSSQMDEINHDIEVISCPPIVLLDEDEMYSREVARRRLKLPLDAHVVYVQLGAGEINDINSEVRITVESLIKHQDVHVVLGESMIGERLDVSLDRVHIIRDYPNSMYFRAFDASVQAGGYNSYHEVSNFGLPTLFYPNFSTGMDDQLARCNVAVEEGWGSVLVNRDKKNIEKSVNELIDKRGFIHEKKQIANIDKLIIDLSERLLAKIK